MFVVRLVWLILFFLPLYSWAQVYTNFTSSALPIIVIDTGGKPVPDDPKIPGTMKIIYNGPGVVNNLTDTQYDFDGLIGIELRGSSSQSFPKKPYAVEIQDASGASIDAPLLGMPKKDDWVLNASYDDKSLMRDALAYKLGRDLGRYASRSRYVELVLNGNYEGVYILLEKVKRDKNRVNIAKSDPMATAGDALTGGYIIKIDKTTASNGAGWNSVTNPLAASVFFQYDYPKAEDITTDQADYIVNYTHTFEQSLLADNFKDPENGYRKYMDMNSMIDFFIMNEVTKNPDGYRLSTYLYKQRDSDGGKFYMGPIWDYNEGFGNVNYCTNGDPQGFAMDFNIACPQDGFQIPFWWQRVFQDSTFKASLGKRWFALRSTVLATTVVQSYVDSVSNVLSASRAEVRNFTAWPVIGVYVWPNYYWQASSYDDEVQWLRNWISDRLHWLDVNIADVISGVNDIPGTFALSAFPNPFQQEITAELTVIQTGTVVTELWDMMGRKLETQSGTYGTPGKYQLYFRTAQTPGVYVIRARSGRIVRSMKVVKRNP